MKKRSLCAAAGLALCLFGGCGAAADDGAQRQIEELQQQIYELQQQVNSQEKPAPEAEMTPKPETEVQDTAPQEQPAASPGQENAPVMESQSAPYTQYSLEELSDMVDAYVEKAGAVDAGSGADLEQFFDLKQECMELERELDWYEDDMERLYREGSLPRDEYRTLERQLDLLEDKLDAAEDSLEYVFGIDD